MVCNLICGWLRFLYLVQLLFIWFFKDPPWILKIVPLATGQYCTLCNNFYFAGSINFLIADGLKFSHPLHHLGKGPEVIKIINTILGWSSALYLCQLHYIFMVEIWLFLTWYQILMFHFPTDIEPKFLLKLNLSIVIIVCLVWFFFLCILFYCEVFHTIPLLFKTYPNDNFHYNCCQPQKYKATLKFILYFKLTRMNGTCTCACSCTQLPSTRTCTCRCLFCTQNAFFLQVHTTECY